MLYSADFETTTQEEDCRVWAWGVCEIGNEDNFIHGNSIESFIEFLKESENSTFYFHNLKFDSEFIMNYLFQNGFEWVKDKKEEKDNTFSTLISDKGQFYSMRIVFKKQGKKTKYVKIYDSLKIIPFSVEEIAKAFGLEMQKLSIDYTAYRAPGHILTEEEISYLKNDVVIVAKALNTLFSQDLNKMTQGSNALHDYKKIISYKSFQRWFPVPDYDADVRQSYKGGFTYLSPAYKNKNVKSGIVLDVNSLYPWVMDSCLLPYGEPIFYEGQYQPDRLYPLYVQMISCQFELKKGYIPTIQLKNNLAFVPTEYVITSGFEMVTMCLTSVDLELFLEHYDVYNITYHSGWKFKAASGLFSAYINKWIKIKNESTINGNKGMRTLAKLMLNALYGKFALNPKVRSKIPYYEEGVIKYRYGDYEEREPIYIAIGTFITSYARHKTITSAQKMRDKFIYADTDSLHLRIDLPEKLQNLSPKEIENLKTADFIAMGLDIPEDFEIDPVKLGAWKCESIFYRGRYLRQKCYIEDANKPETWRRKSYDKSLLNITCAGMPKSCYPFVTWDNFHYGAQYAGKLQPKHVPGGIVLKEIDFTIIQG